MILGSPVGVMYKTDDIAAIRDFMMSRRETLSVAESVTSGHLQAAISLATDASLFFQGGITTYNLGQKSRHLHVNPIHAMSCNSVSPGVAGEMAVHASLLFSSDWSLAITGYAAPVPEKGIERLHAFYAIAFRREVVSSGEVESADMGTMKVQLYYTRAVLTAFRDHLAKFAGDFPKKGGDSHA